MKCFISYADKLLEGDEVLVHRNHELTAVKVINISSHTMQGSYGY